ncbi:MAG: DUF998 domain-containing protein [Bacteroidota bacterium]|nr:DUF998 domain-containing protein [Bacteroidota bacterium]
MYVKRLRRIYITISILLGILSPIICYILLPEFNIIKHPLSYFGIVEQTNMFWQFSLIIISFGLVINGIRRVNQFIKRKNFHIILKSILIVSTIFLILTALFTMKYDFWHHLFAILFFLTYNFFVFLFGIIRSLSYVRRGINSVIIGCLMLLSSLLILPFPSSGIAEVIYITLIILWNSLFFLKGMKYQKAK